MPRVDGIQIMRLKTDQSFEVTPEVKAVKGEGGKTIPGRPGSSTERIKLILDAKDTSANPGGDQITKYKEALAQTPYFLSQHIAADHILLKNLSTPQTDTESGRAYVLFSLECRYPDRVPLTMNNLSSQKRNHLILAGMATMGVIAGLWFGVIALQRNKIQEISGKIEAARQQIDKVQKVVVEAGAVEDALKISAGKLDQIEAGIPSTSGDLFSWIVSAVKQFNVASYKVEMPQFGNPVIGEVNMLSGFPYRQVSFGVGGTAYYYDFGKFLADLENHFPYMRVQNLALEPGGGSTPEEKEKLSFHMDLITLVKTNSP